jgi:hypothetical protein
MTACFPSALSTETTNRLYVASKIFTKCCYFEAIQSAIMTASEGLIEALYPMGNVYKKNLMNRVCMFLVYLKKRIG